MNCSLKGHEDRKKHLGLTVLTNFCVVWKERNIRAFQGAMEEIERVRDRWYNILSCLVIGNVFHY